MQLQYGYHRKNLRTPNTLTALSRLHRAHLLTTEATTALIQGYIFLRTLEHRLQLLHGFQTQNLPPEEEVLERTRIALRMGYQDRATFEADLERHRSILHQLLKELFYGSEDTPPPQSVLAVQDWHELDALLDHLESPTVLERLDSSEDAWLPTASRHTEGASAGFNVRRAKGL